MEWLREVDALEVKSHSTEERTRKTLDYVTKDLGVPIPLTFGSDSHDGAPSAGGMWVKMAEPSLASLRQLTFEPELRVSRTEPAAPSHGRIVGFTTTRGIYPNERFRFSPHLNVLLGGRGAGKSAAIDLLRFAFEAETRGDDKSAEVFTERIMGFLQSVGEVVVVIVGADAETYVVQRSGAFEKPNPRSLPIFTEPPRVYQVAGDELIQRDVRAEDILPIEFYGQGEVALLADRVDEQLRMIDENIDHTGALASIASAESTLEEGERQLATKKRELEALRVTAAKRPSLEDRLERLAESLDDPIFDRRKSWEQEQLWIQRQQDWVNDQLQVLPATLSPPADFDIDIEDSPVAELLTRIHVTSGRALEGGQTDLNRLRQTLTEAASELNDLRDEWSAAFSVADKEYRERLAELEIANLDAVAVEQRSVENELTHIRTIVEPEIEGIESAIRVLESDRATLLQELGDARRALAESRSTFAEEMNARLGGNVRIDLSRRDVSLLFDAVDSALQGSGIQRREEQVMLASEAWTPQEFAEVIRTRAVGELTSLGITPNAAERMVSSLDDDVLYQVERVDTPQLPVIRIKREGEDEYTDLSSLSVGEKCSAILSIALVSKGKPLIIDQPEDDLDHAFIINSIVEGIRTAKSDRQIIVATHNPNIPVLGDAEMVFRVSRQAGRDICSITNSGGLELPQVTAEVQSLEGGAEAFERRRQKYSGVS